MFAFVRLSILCAHVTIGGLELPERHLLTVRLLKKRPISLLHGNDTLTRYFLSPNAFEYDVARSIHSIAAIDDQNSNPEELTGWLERWR